ncbi:MAG: 3-deoxy-7-phosphoheptulonate synthase [Arenicellales bacterium]|nr:3-deoxy-7-phosphoheptulonate synthase [Arenicellales bacterium]
MREQINDLNVVSQDLIPTPEQIKSKLPLNDQAAQTVLAGRETVRNILDKKDPRLFTVVGPCSIHDISAAHEYAEKLRSLADQVKDTMVLIMRVYFEKPRTTVGWKGLINDPHMDDSCEVETGLNMARELLLHVAEMGLAAGTEALDPIMPQYLSDLVAWFAIGARTVESQTHRELASGLSAPVGFKNGTDGSLDVAINALKSASQPHHFLGINQQAQSTVVHTRGNRYGHMVLRGGGGQHNYDSVSIALSEQQLTKAGLPTNLVIDCSHGNSNKDPALQKLVFANCINQIMEGNKSIIGLMLESNLNWGNQVIPEDLSTLEYGVSITDACIDWSTTEETILSAHENLQQVRRKVS